MDATNKSDGCLDISVNEPNLCKPKLLFSNRYMPKPTLNKDLFWTQQEGKPQVETFAFNSMTPIKTNEEIKQSIVDSQTFNSQAKMSFLSSDLF